MMSAPNSGFRPKWTWAFVAIVACLFLTRGGFAAVVPLVRACLPALVAVLVYKLVKNQVRQMLGHDPRANLGDPRRGGPVGGAEAGKVIDLCPKCGTYMQAGHRCAPR